jgi:hypothetical protein
LRLGRSMTGWSFGSRRWQVRGLEYIQLLCFAFPPGLKPSSIQWPCARVETLASLRIEFSAGAEAHPVLLA